jgi:hypothetical protein
MSLTAFIEEAVEDKLNKDRSCRGEPLHFELITFRGEGTYHGVDLDSGVVPLMKTGKGAQYLVAYAVVVEIDLLTLLYLVSYIAAEGGEFEHQAHLR